jgi:hypothetical protein
MLLLFDLTGLSGTRSGVWIAERRQLPQGSGLRFGIAGRTHCANTLCIARFRAAFRSPKRASHRQVAVVEARRRPNHHRAHQLGTFRRGGVAKRWSSGAIMPNCRNATAQWCTALCSDCASKLKMLIPIRSSTRSPRCLHGGIDLRKGASAPQRKSDAHPLSPALGHQPIYVPSEFFRQFPICSSKQPLLKRAAANHHSAVQLGTFRRGGGSRSAGVLVP